MEKRYIKEIYDMIYVNHNTITTDSRVCPEGSVFFALKGDNFNGNKFADKAIESGCAYAVIDEAEYKKDDRYLLVDDVLATLQDLARHHRSLLKIPVIGITGTNGKTTTKELTHSVLEKKYNVLATEGNLNNHIGVPLTILKIRDEHEIAVIEMGASHPGDIEFLCSIARPTHGLITNVGMAHLEGFKTYEGVLKTKTELYASLGKDRGTIFVFEDNKYLFPFTSGIHTVIYGESECDYLKGRQTGCTPYLTFEFTSNGSTFAVNTNLIGGYNFPNTLAAAAIGKYFDVADTDIRDALESYEPANKRSQLVKTEKNTLILDAYNANPTSMMAALKNFAEMQVDKKMVILGDMRELGAESRKEHENIVNYLKDAPFDEIILVGHEFASVNDAFTTLKGYEMLNDWIATHNYNGYYILIKGSRGIALEKGIENL